MKFGAHMPTIGGPSKGLERGIAIGCDIVQSFLNKIRQALDSRAVP